jgi:FAD/FMN-containing dehydrogenase
VSTVDAARRAASTDYAHLSPVLSAALPGRWADIVVYPHDVDELTAAVDLAYLHDVPIVPRGRGTGNYGQAVPLAAGMVVDLSGMDSVLEARDGWIRAQAGVSFVELEAAARQTGQEIALMPTTVGSTIGGFLAGGAGGLGSIEHGFLWDGFVGALDVVIPAADPLHPHGDDCLPYLHAYGVTGIIAAATVRLAPAQERVAVVASFDSHAAAARAGLELIARDPAPRLVSVDDPALVALYPPDDCLPADRFSLRAVVDEGFDTDEITRLGGRLELASSAAVGYLSTLAFNHVTLRAKKTRPGLCHLQVSGEALVTDPDAVRSVLPGAMLHLDGLSRTGFGGLLLSEFRDVPTLYAGIDRLRELGVFVVDPHTWLLGGPALEAIRRVAQANDPKGLLNPGKLPGQDEA